MKKLIALLLALALCVGLVACGGPVEPSQAPVQSADPAPTPAPTPEADTLADAVAYVKTIYKKVAEITAKDYQRVGVVPVGTEKYEVVWSVDVAEDLIKIVKGEDGMVTIDVNEEATAETPYVLTATITGKDGKSESLNWNHVLPAAMNVDGLTYAEIVDLAYALEDQMVTEDAFRLYGTVTSIDTAWSEDYQNITVTIVVDGKEEQPIQCYRLKGEGAKDLKVGDDITVEGILKNYKGTYEFDAGCVLIGYGEHVDQKALLKAAFALGEGASMDYPAVMTGTIVKIPSAWSDEYGNITVDMEIDGQIVQCYRLKGEGAKDLKEGNVITVAGIIKNYKGTVEFDAGCLLVPNKMYHSVKNALSGYKLLDGEAQTAAKTITGTITKIDTPWSEDYQNITVTMVVAGLENYPIMCYRLKGEGAKELAEGNVITVEGILKNYKGTIEFDAGCTLIAGNTGAEPAPEPSVEPTPAPSVEPTPAPSVEPTPAPSAEPTPAPAPSAEPTPAPSNPGADIVKAAYKLKDGEKMTEASTLSGVVVKVNTAWSDQYNNITVTIVVGDMKDYPIMCYRLKGTGASGLKVGDIITVTGTLKNYMGTIEFDAGCNLDSIDGYKEPEVVTGPTDPAEIVAAAFALAPGQFLPYSSTLTGVIVSVDTPWSDDYKNITVTIEVAGRTIMCYRLKGNGAAGLSVGQSITVTGTLMNYQGTIEFEAGCTLNSIN